MAERLSLSGKSASSKRIRSMSDVATRLLRDPDIRSGFERGMHYAALGRMIRDLRESLGLSQAQLAERIGSSQPDIVRIERGQGSRGPTVDMLTRLADACGRRLVVGFADVSDKSTDNAAITALQNSREFCVL